MEQGRPLGIRHTFIVAAPVLINESDQWRSAVFQMCHRPAIEEHMDHPSKGKRKSEDAYDNGGYKCNPGY